MAKRNTWTDLARLLRASLAVVLCCAIGATVATAQATGDAKSQGAGDAPAAGSERTIAGIPFVWCPPGVYTRGLSVSQLELEDFFSKPREEWYGDALPRHEVTISRGFWMSKTEVTRAQWFDAMQTRPWEDEAESNPGSSVPATHLTWNDAVALADYLERNSGERFRLPTEAEWEYACRAGTTSLFNYGNDRAAENENVWHWGNTVRADESYPHEAGTKAANAWGLHDMHGNVWEWCRDNYARYSAGSKTDPLKRNDTPLRVIRGASYEDWSSLQLACFRSAAIESSRHHGIGVRLVVEARP